MYSARTVLYGHLWPEWLYNIFPHYLIKVKESSNRPGVAQRVPGGLNYQIFITFGT